MAVAGCVFNRTAEDSSDVSNNEAGTLVVLPPPSRESVTILADCDFGFP
jgi:hypothetical protein